jgi:fengycin family lipopeptide synthetase B
MSSQGGTQQQRLAGQRVLITGAGRGIGRAIAIICSNAGAKVAIASRTKHELEETASRMNGVSLHHVADVNDSEQVQTMVDSIVDQWGGIDILINNAGVAQNVRGPFDTLDSEDLLRLLTVNVVAVHRVTSTVVSHMKPGSKIVNISSRAGKLARPSISFYVASKFALEGLTAAMAVELRERQIQVNSISPGMVNTTSFPKPDGQPGVRTAESIQDGLFAILDSGVTGHYLHVDELDMVRTKGLADDLALKRIDEPNFDPEL